VSRSVFGQSSTPKHEANACPSTRGASYYRTLVLMRYLTTTKQRGTMIVSLNDGTKRGGCDERREKLVHDYE
jgi:hypothetical protein